MQSRLARRIIWTRNDAEATGRCLSFPMRRTRTSAGVLGGMVAIGAFLILALCLVLPGCDRRGAGSKRLAIDLGGGVMMEFVLVQPGTFAMGSEKGRSNERPVHVVSITKPFYLGKYEVTQEQWRALMDRNPSQVKSPKYPVESVSWDDCQSFLAKLASKTPGKKPGLPTEAQWEYACRAGAAAEFSFGQDANGLGDYGWYGRNSEATTHPVGQKKPNAWGLYDMYGNVSEWCADWDGDYQSIAATDPAGPQSGESRVVRGGSWDLSYPESFRSAYRHHFTSDYSGDHIGFRVVLMPSP